MSLNTTPTTPQTLLDAVNELLGAVRISAVMSLTAADLNEDAADALAALTQASRSVQLKGYNFNTLPDAVLDPNAQGEVLLPQNTLKVRSVRCSGREGLVLRGRRLFDPRKRTYAIGASVTVDLVEALEFEDLPEPARAYITALGARRFCPPRQPSGSTFRYTEDFLAAALVDMEQTDSESRYEDLKETSPHFAAMARR